jgi:protein phosphatase
MIDLANLRGGPDNITVVVGEVKNDGLMRSGAAMDTNPSAVAPQFPVAFGIATAIGLLCCVVLLLLNQFPVALLAAGAAAVAFATGWFKYQAQRVNNEVTGQYGRGPYRKAICKPDASFTANLTQVISELNDWISENDWKIRSSQIEEDMRVAKAAEHSKNYGEAIRRYVSVIALTMEEVRKQQDGQGGDSAIDY